MSLTKQLVRVGISVNNFGKTMKVSWVPVTWLQPANNEFLKLKTTDPSQKAWFINIMIPDLLSNIISQRKQKLFIVHDEYTSCFQGDVKFMKVHVGSIYLYIFIRYKYINLYLYIIYLYILSHLYPFKNVLYLL